MTSTTRFRHACISVFLLSLLGGGGVLAQREAESLSESFRKAAERVLPSVVAIRPAPGIGRTPVRTPYARGPWSGLEGPGSWPGRGMMGGTAGGSGIVVDAQRGLILTTASNVDGASQVWVVLADGREAPTTRVILDPRSDLAVLSIDPKAGPLAQVEWGESDTLRMGDWVLAVARPTGPTRSISAGIVSGVEAVPFGPVTGEVSLIRSDVRPAASGPGGPLINLSGQVVGINRIERIAGPAVEDLTHAIPSELARRVASELAEHGRVRRGYLGLTVGPSEFAPPDQPAGLIVSSVSPSSPAAEAGFRLGDRILTIDGRAVTELEALARAVEAAPVGQEFRIEVDRGGKRTELSVKSRERPEPGVIVPRPVIPGPRVPDRRLRPRVRPREGAPVPAIPPRRNAPLQSEGPDGEPDLSAPAPGAEVPKVQKPQTSPRRQADPPGR